MKHIITFLFIIAIFGISFMIAPAVLNPTGFVVAQEDVDKNETKLPSFRLFTSAECQNISGFIVCHDELYASCGDVDYKLPKNGVNGKAVFDGDWIDPRNAS